MEKLSRKLKLATGCLLFFLLTLLAGFCWGRISYANESVSVNQGVVRSSRTGAANTIAEAVMLRCIGIYDRFFQSAQVAAT